MHPILPETVPDHIYSFGQVHSGQYSQDAHIHQSSRKIPHFPEWIGNTGEVPILHCFRFASNNPGNMDHSFLKDEKKQLQNQEQAQILVNIYGLQLALQ